MEEFNKGLYVTLFGMGLTFLSLGLIMCSIWGMERIFRQKETVEENEAPTLVVSDPNLTEEEDRVAAAIAVALALALEEETERERGKWVTIASAHGGSSPWTAQGRQIHMSSRNIARETRRR